MYLEYGEASSKYSSLIKVTTPFTTIYIKYRFSETFKTYPLPYLISDEVKKNHIPGDIQSRPKTIVTTQCLFISEYNYPAMTTVLNNRKALNIAFCITESI